MRPLSPHFSEEEMFCRCGCDPSLEVRENLLHTCEHLEVIRALLGPMEIHSGHRCEKHNIKENGGKFSKHLTGHAADFKIQSPTGSYYNGLWVAGFLEALIIAKTIPQGGVGTYEKFPNLIHYDWRGVRARWRYS